MEIVIPEFLKHLPIDKRGYPIPFFVPIKDGIPEFRFADVNKFNLCTEKKLCWICGRKLIKNCFFFLTGPHGLANRVQSDCPMHRECAEATMQLCPHIFYGKAERKENVKFSYQAQEKPDIIYLIRSSKYKIIPSGEGNTQLIRFNVISTVKYIYKDNELTLAEP